MIFKSSFPNSPVVRMTIDGVAVDYTSIESVEMSISENEHDYARFTFVGLIPRAITEYIDRPVYISIQASPTQKAIFHGYVGYIEPESQTRRGHINNSPIQKAHVHCFGASYDMKQKRSRIWENKTLKLIIEKLAKEYNYSFAVPTDTFVIPRIVQNKESDWEMLVKTCKLLGYRVTASNAHIHVYDPFKTIARAMPYAELTTIFKSKENTAYAPGRVMEFTGTFGQVTPEGSSNLFTFEGLSNDGKVVSHTTEATSMNLGKVFGARFTDTVTTNTPTKEALVKYAKATVNNRAPFHAEVIVTGLPEVIPGSLVNLNKYESKFDGFWMVQSVTHKMTRSNYITELKIVRDSTTDEPITRVAGDAYIAPDYPVLVQGTWKAPVTSGYEYI